MQAMPAYFVFLPVIVAVLNLMVLSVMVFYIWMLKGEKKKLEKQQKDLSAKETRLENGYRQAIDSALNKERRILDEATRQASLILANTKQTSDSSKNALEKALQKMMVDIQKEAGNTSNNFAANYKKYLGQITDKSLVDFQSITKKFEDDMQKQSEEFRKSILPQIQKELEDYKQKRFEEADVTIGKIIQNVTEKVLNKSISLEDHKKLIIAALDKAKNDGLFN